MSVGVDFSLNQMFYHSDADRPPLRVGVLIDGTIVRAYARAVLEDIEASNFAKIVVYVSNCIAPAAPAADMESMHRRTLRLLPRFRDPDWRRGLAFAAYQRLYVDRRSPEPDPLAAVDCSDLMSQATVLQVAPRAKGFVDRLTDSDVEAVRALDLDVLLRFGFRIIRGDILSAAKHGVWSFHHGDSEHYRGGPAYFWELVERNPVSGVVLQRLNEQLDAGEVLARGLFATSPSLSLSENRFGPYWSAQHFVIRSLHELHQRGLIHVSVARQPARYYGKQSIYRRPTNVQLISWLGTELVRRSTTYALRRVRSALIPRTNEGPHWRIALRRLDVPLYEQANSRALLGFRWLEKPRGRFWADPFIVEREGRAFLFLEDFDESQQKGSIAAANILPDGTIDEPRSVLERPYHLSYPHVFEHQGEMFMIPESQQAGCVVLYRARRFPDDWVPETTLLKGRLVDSTVFEFDGRWWLFGSPRVVPGHAALTYVWSADVLTGPWRLASYSPLNDDVRNARGAGRVFMNRGELWRPAQDCSVHYGRALGFNHIRCLDGVPREEVVRVVEARGTDGMVGLHTYNRSDNWEVIDGYFAHT
jgi:hypothetical protein